MAFGWRRSRWRSVAFTHPGLKRGHNEDSVVAVPGRPVWAVADGMGGHAQGEVASALVVAEIERAAQAGLDVDDALRAAHEAINARAEADDSNMGSTAVILSLDPEATRYTLAWVGDSRGYRLAGGRLELLTEDHTVVAELYRRGVLTAEEAGRHPERGTLSRAIGRANPGSLDIQTRTDTVGQGDVFLLCSDGLSNCVDEDRIARILGSRWSLPYRGRQLIDGALQAGAPDNVSVVLVEVTRPGGGR